MAGWADSVLYEDGAGDPEGVQKQRVGKIAGYESHASFLNEMRERYESGYGFDEHNINAGKDDAKFVLGKQWDEVVEEKRKAARKPILTVNRLVAFVAQIVGNRLMNETEIRVYPDKAGTKEVAKIREGLIRSIYKNSLADYARDEALKYQVIGGQGIFYLSIDYAGDDVFEQEIKVKHSQDPYAAIFDPAGTEPTGGDCNWIFLTESMPHKTFKERWPWAAEVAFESNSAWDKNGYWNQEETVRIASYWRMVTEGVKLLALYEDGTVQDVTDKEPYEYELFVAQRDGRPVIREVPNRFARMYLVSGNAVLEGPFDYPISSIPVYRVPGWEVTDGEKLYRWGLTRFLKDPQRLHNYWRSVLAEQLVAAPRNKWLATKESIQGHETRWRNSPSSDDPFLFYNDGETMPTHVPPPGIDSALLNEAGMATQDIKDISNIHEASLGMQGNEVSGKAIHARQSVSDVGSFIYHDRLRLADERWASNINELIPYIYDTMRTVTVLGEDGKPKMETINQPDNENTDITLGKYGITVSVGPATATKRQLASEQMMAFVNAIPGAAEPVMDLIAEAQDWPKAGEFARRFRKLLPAGTVDAEDMSDAEREAMQGNQEMAQLEAQLEQRDREADIAKKEKEAILAEKRAIEAEAKALKAMADARARVVDVEGKNEEREVKLTLDVVDQHNRLESEDREFETRREASLKENTSE